MKLFESRVPWAFGFLVALGLTALSPFMGADLPEGSGFFASNEPPAEDLSCTCNLRGETFTQMSYETAAECDSGRRYEEPGLAAFRKLDPHGVFTRSRDSALTANRIPRKCFLFAMKHTLPPVFRTNLFGVCDATTPRLDDGTDFERTNFKPCVTEELVNVIYNSYLDAADCFDVPPKFALAKFMNESGVMPNIVAANNDAGLAQFSTGAMKIMKREHASWSRWIMRSKKASCRALAKLPGALPSSPDEIETGAQAKCHLIKIPSNPVRNFILYGAFYRIMKDDVAASFDRRESIDPFTGEPRAGFRSVVSLMREAGIGEFDRDRIREILMVMAYNMGPKSVTYFREWLGYRIAKFPRTAILRADLSVAIDPDPWSVIDKMTKEQLAAMYDRGGKRAMSFWEWLVVNKNKFRYASFVKFYANRLDANLGSGVCTPERFLEP